MSNSLSSVVSGLVRAQMGATLSPMVNDSDLDAHVAALILKEAKQKAERYGTEGVKAYLPSNDNPVRKTDKRFLTSIIRRTDDHNRSVLRAQAAAAEEAKAEREEEERKERRARAEEAAEAERMRMRRLMGNSVRRGDSTRDRDRERDRLKERRGDQAGKGKRRERSWERRSEDEDDTVFEQERERRREDKRPTRDYDDQGDQDRRKRHSERRPRRRRSRSRDCAEEEYTEGGSTRSSRRSRRHDDRSRSRSLSPNSRAAADDKRRRRSRRDDERRRSRSPRQSDERDRDRKRRKRSVSPRGKEARSDASPQPSTTSGSRSHKSEAPPPPVRRRPSPARVKSSTPLRPPRSPSPGPSEPTSSSAGHIPSRMDKYFESSYDPRLDVAPLAAPVIPATGLIPDEEFAGWDAMLELIKIRRQDKEEKKWLDKHGFNPDVKEIGKARKEGAGQEEPGVMDIVYKKKGAVREWDMGKDGMN